PYRLRFYLPPLSWLHLDAAAPQRPDGAAFADGADPRRGHLRVHFAARDRQGLPVPRRLRPAVRDLPLSKLLHRDSARTARERPNGWRQRRANFPSHHPAARLSRDRLLCGFPVSVGLERPAGRASVRLRNATSDGRDPPGNAELRQQCRCHLGGLVPVAHSAADPVLRLPALFRAGASRRLGQGIAVPRQRSPVVWLVLGAIALQLGHQFEHVVQMIQMHVDGQPPAFAHGLIGRLDLEWVHFGLTVTIALVALIILANWSRNPFAWLLMPLALWHLAEHSVILITYLRTGITGTPGILAHGGLLNGPLPRPDLHFLYNAAILLLLIGVWAWQRRRPRVKGSDFRRNRMARVLAGGVSLGLAAALSLLVLSGARGARWLDERVSL